MLNSGKKFRASRNKNIKYFNSCVVRKKNSETKQKTITCIFVLKAFDVI